MNWHDSMGVKKYQIELGKILLIEIIIILNLSYEYKNILIK